MNTKPRHYHTLTEEQMKTIGVELGVIEDKELTSSLKSQWCFKSAESE